MQKKTLSQKQVSLQEREQEHARGRGIKQWENNIIPKDTIEIKNKMSNNNGRKGTEYHTSDGQDRQGKGRRRATEGSGGCGSVGLGRGEEGGRREEGGAEIVLESLENEETDKPNESKAARMKRETCQYWNNVVSVPWCAAAIDQMLESGQQMKTKEQAREMAKRVTMVVANQGQ